MQREGLPMRQLWLWLVLAVVPVAVQLSDGNWLWCGVVAVACTLLGWLAWNYGKWEWRWGRLARYGVLVALLGSLLGLSEGSWPGSEHIAVPLVLLVLAAWSAGKGARNCAAVGCVLGWFVLAGYIALILAGVKDARLEWLRPEWMGKSWDAACVLLAPVVAAAMSRPEDRWGGRLMVPYLVVVAAAVLTGAVMAGRGSFYEMCRSLEFLGVAKRFEAVVSALMTVGWFGWVSFCLTMCGSVLKERRKAGIYAAAVIAGVMLLCKVHINPAWLVVSVTIFWVFVPALEQGIGAEKKS